MRIAQLALTVLVTWLIVSRVGLGLGDLRALGPAAWRPDLALLAGSCVLLALGYAASAAIWGRMVVDLGGPALPMFDVVRLFMIANLGRYIPGKVWQIAGLAALAKRRGVPPATATGAAVLGQGIALVAASAVGMGALLQGPEGVRRWGVAAAVALGATLVVGVLPPVFRRIAGLWFRLARQDPPASLGSVHAIRWLALFAANWALYAIAFWVLAASFGYNPPFVPVASAFAAAYVLGYVMIFAPAGVGVREGFLIAFLTPHLGAGPSGVLAVAARLWTTLVEILPAGAFWLAHILGRGPATKEEQAGG